MKYAFFIASFFLFPLYSFALVYDEVTIVDGSVFATRLDFENTDYFKCERKCTKITSIPQPLVVAQSSYSLLSGFGTNLPPVIRALKTDDNRFVASFRSDGKNRVIQIVDLVTQKSYLRTEIIKNEILLEETRLLAWDNHTLYYLSDFDGRRAVYKINADLIPTAGFSVEKIAGGDFEVADFTTIPGGSLAYVANPEGPYIWQLFIRKENNIHQIDTDVSNIAGLTIKGEELFYSAETDAGFEAHVYNIKGDKISKLKLPEVKNFKDLRKPTFETKIFGNLTGVLVKPSSQDSSKNMIVWLHGGPHRQASLVLNPIRSYGTYDATLINIVNQTGAYVLKLDYPGSVGHGNTLANSIYRNVGGLDVKELALSIEAAKRDLGIEKVFIGGTSYGGYLGLKFLAERPELVDGVFAINSVTDWKFLFDTVNGSPLIKLFGDKKETVPEYLWTQADILGKIGNVPAGKPIIVAYGDKDDNVPIGQSMIMTHFLKSKDKNVSELIFKDEKHTIVKKSSVKTFCLEFMKLLGVKKKSCDI